jgi:hypothetical protein
MIKKEDYKTIDKLLLNGDAKQINSIANAITKNTTDESFKRLCYITLVYWERDNPMIDTVLVKLSEPFRSRLQGIVRIQAVNSGRAPTTIKNSGSQ